MKRCLLKQKDFFSVTIPPTEPPEILKEVIMLSASAKSPDLIRNRYAIVMLLKSDIISARLS
jgi:hypothetical protein